MENLSLCTKDSFNEVLRHYSSMVYRLAYSRTGSTFDADDILQEVFLRYVRADNTYNDEEHRKAWLIKATVNCTKTLALSAWNRHRSGDEPEESEMGAEDEGIKRTEIKSIVTAAVLELPKKYRTVVHLFYYEDMSVTEIAAALNIAENTVKSQLHRARNLLKEKLKGVEPE